MALATRSSSIKEPEVAPVSTNPALTHPTLTPVIEAGVEDLTQRGTRGSEHVARTVIAKAVWEAYRHGRRDAIGELVTTAQAADILRIDVSQVRRLAAAQNLGWQIERGVRLFRPEDVEAMRDRPRRGTYPRRSV